MYEFKIICGYDSRVFNYGEHETEELFLVMKSLAEHQAVGYTDDGKAKFEFKCVPGDVIDYGGADCIATNDK